jgi:putative oxidoreductase
MYKDIGLLVLRLTFGLTMLLSHGQGKLLNFSSLMNSFPDPLGIGNSLSLGLAIGAEVGCALLLALGLFTRWVSIPLIITMAVAFFIVHGGHEWGKREMSFIYMGAYIGIGLLGSGRFSLDHLIRKKS